MNIWAGVAFYSFLVSMIFFVTAEVLAVLKLKRKECTATRAFLWFEVLGFLSVSSDGYTLYDRGSDRLKDCEKQWWDALSQVARDGKLAPEDAWKVIVNMKSVDSVKRFMFMASMEKYARIIGVVLYVVAFVLLYMLQGPKGWLWGSLLIPLWNIYKVYYVYGVFRPIVNRKVYRTS